MKVYLLFERRFAHVAAGPTEQIVYCARFTARPSPPGQWERLAAAIRAAAVAGGAK